MIDSLTPLSHPDGLSILLCSFVPNKGNDIMHCNTFNINAIVAGVYLYALNSIGRGMMHANRAIMLLRGS